MMSGANDFIEHIRKQHPHPEKFDEFIAACKRPLRKSIRVNTLKISIDAFLTVAQRKDWSLQPIPWCDKGFWIQSKLNAELQLGTSIEHQLGLFYIQEASSMVPVSILLRDGLYQQEDQYYLDMAAAPGSKTTQLAATIDSNSLILANELSSSRMKVLHANLSRMGVSNYCLHHGDGVHLSDQIQNHFDAILLDAPCSGEGTIRKDPKALSNWSLDSIESIANVQKQLIDSAWKMLKPGGRLIYSTCTLSHAENHDVIRRLTEQHSDAEIEDLSQAFEDASVACTLEGFLHLWPENYDSEGFFVASIKKRGLLKLNVPHNEATINRGFSALSKKQFALLQQYYQQHFEFDITPIAETLACREQKSVMQIWSIPRAAVELKESLKLQRAGIRICDIVSGRTESHIKTQHEMINSYGNEFQKQIFEIDEDQCKSILMGNNLQFSSDATNTVNLIKGECLLRFNNHPIGMSKVIIKTNQVVIKNNLPRHLLR